MSVSLTVRCLYLGRGLGHGLALLFWSCLDLFICLCLGFFLAFVLVLIVIVVMV